MKSSPSPLLIEDSQLSKNALIAKNRIQFLISNDDSTDFIYSFSENYILSLGIILLVGFGIAGFGATQASVVQLSTNNNERPLAMGLLSICIGTSPIGSFLYGTIAESYGAQLTVRALPITGFIIFVAIILVTNVMHTVTSEKT